MEYFFLTKIIKIIFFSKKLPLKNKKGTMSWKYKNMKKYHKNIKTDTLGVTPDYATIQSESFSDSDSDSDLEIRQTLSNTITGLYRDTGHM
jgi:hypothetical protein